jgi:hypothetical protein
MNIKQAREVVAMNRGTLPLSVRAALLKSHWRDVNEMRDQRELHGTATWFVAVPHPQRRGDILDLLVSARVDGSLLVDDLGALVISGWCASSASILADETPPPETRDRRVAGIPPA